MDTPGEPGDQERNPTKTQNKGELAEVIEDAIGTHPKTVPLLSPNPREAQTMEEPRTIIRIINKT